MVREEHARIDEMLQWFRKKGRMHSYEIGRMKRNSAQTVSSALESAHDRQRIVEVTDEWIEVRCRAVSLLLFTLGAIHLRVALHVLEIEQLEIRDDLQKEKFVSRARENSIPRHLLLRLLDVDQLASHIMCCRVRLFLLRETAIEYYHGHSIGRRRCLIVFGSRCVAAIVDGAAEVEELGIGK